MINFLIKYKTELLYINIFRSVIILISYLVSKEYFELSFFYTLKIPFLINILPLILGGIMTTAFSLPILLILKKLDFKTEKVIKQSIIKAIVLVVIIIVTISLWLYYFKFND